MPETCNGQDDDLDTVVDNGFRDELGRYITLEDCGELATGGAFLSDSGRLLGPLTPRLLGYAMAGLGELVVFLAVLRRPTRDGLLLGLAASVLVAFCFLTTMHERYSYAAVIFLAAAMSGRARAAAWRGRLSLPERTALLPSGFLRHAPGLERRG